jgi:predicted HD phosphohydrolase
MKTLFEFYRERFNQKGPLPFAPGPHMIQSAMRALKSGAPEETILACLLHDAGFALHAADHGYWGAQLVASWDATSANRAKVSGKTAAPSRTCGARSRIQHARFEFP